MRHRKINVDRVFHALGDPTRRQIVKRLSSGPMSASALAAPLSVSLAAVVQHLQILEAAGVLATVKTGRTRTCSIVPSGLSAAEAWISGVRSTWERRLDRLADVLGDEE